MEKLLEFMRKRLEHLEAITQQGIIPGVQDSFELEQMIGRIKEQKYVISRLEENCATTE